MTLSTKVTGYGCKYFGIWLLMTSGLLVYAETAPMIEEPDFRWALGALVLGVVFFYFGCMRCKGDEPPIT